MRNNTVASAEFDIPALCGFFFRSLSSVTTFQKTSRARRCVICSIAANHPFTGPNPSLRPSLPSLIAAIQILRARRFHVLVRVSLLFCLAHIPPDGSGWLAKPQNREEDPAPRSAAFIVSDLFPGHRTPPRLPTVQIGRSGGLNLVQNEAVCVEGWSLG